MLSLSVERNSFKVCAVCEPTDYSKRVVEEDTTPFYKTECAAEEITFDGNTMYVNGTSFTLTQEMAEYIINRFNITNSANYYTFTIVLGKYISETSRRVKYYIDNKQSSDILGWLYDVSMGL